MATAVVAAVAAGGVAAILTSPSLGHPAWGPSHPVVIALPTRPTSYIGAYAAGMPASYAPMNSFRMMLNGVQPNIAPYNSAWGEPFRSGFASTAAAHHAVPLVQIDPRRVSLAAITAGRYDSYLRTFGEAVGDFGERTRRAVIIGFGQQPNGTSCPWDYKHIRPSVWIHAWRHIVTLFRREGVDDVTWLWTVRAINPRSGDISPVRWWPGSEYVTWIGIDGYYYRPSTRFTSLFGATIKTVRSLTHDPILISQTGAQPEAGKAVKITDVFRGVRSYGLLGLVWLNVRRWRINTPASAAAFAAAARTWHLTPL